MQEVERGVREGDRAEGAHERESAAVRAAARRRHAHRARALARRGAAGLHAHNTRFLLKSPLIIIIIIITSASEN